jgi:hypothetical protein
VDHPVPSCAHAAADDAEPAPRDDDEAKTCTKKRIDGL